MKYLTFILLISITNVFCVQGQVLKIKVYNQTGHNVDSLICCDQYIGKLKKGAAITISTCRQLWLEYGLPMTSPRGAIKGIKKSSERDLRCGIDAEKVYAGDYKFDLTLKQDSSGYRLIWEPHKNASN